MGQRIQFLVFYLILILLIRFGMETGNSQGIILKKEETAAIRGIGMLLIMFSHIADPSVLSTYFFYVSGILGVSSCFLVSGYGLAKRYSKNEYYLSGFLVVKFCRCLIPYLFVFVGYLIQTILTGTFPGFQEILRQICTLQMASCPLWYLKVQLLMYVFFAFTFGVFKDTQKKLFVLYAFVLAYCVILWKFKIPAYWYKSSLFFPAGVMLSYHDIKILTVLRKNRIRILSGLLTSFIFFILYFRGWMGHELMIDGAYMIVFNCFILGISNYVQNSGFLCFMGKFSLEIYLIHCILLATVPQTILNGKTIAGYCLLMLFTLVAILPLHYLSMKMIGYVRTVCRVAD